MKEENKKEIKKGFLTGVGTATGAVLGALVENTINAADVEDKNPMEVEVVEANAEGSDEIQDAEHSNDSNSDSSDGIITEATAHAEHPERKTVNQSHAVSAGGHKAEDKVDPVVEAEALIEAETDSEVAVVEEADIDEDIMVVSVVPEVSDDEDTNVCDVATDTSDIEEVSEDDDFAPDYAGMKDNNLSVGDSMISSLDMPDYVNDANIDSFTDNV